MTQLYRTALWVKNLYGRKSGGDVHGVPSVTPYLVDELLRNSPPKGQISIHLDPLMLHTSHKARGMFMARPGRNL